MADMMQFPETWEEYEEQYGFTDKEEIYTNGSRLIQSFRVKQWLDHIKPNAGEWIAMDEDLKISDYRCYKCGHYQDEISNFCPNCGARMLGGEEE